MLDAKGLQVDRCGSLARLAVPCPFWKVDLPFLDAVCCSALSPISRRDAGPGAVLLQLSVNQQRDPVPCLALVADADSRLRNASDGACTLMASSLKSRRSVWPEGCTLLQASVSGNMDWGGGSCLLCSLVSDSRSRWVPVMLLAVHVLRLVGGCGVSEAPVEDCKTASLSMVEEADTSQTDLLPTCVVQ